MIQYISYDAAIKHLNDLGLQEIDFSNIVEGGLTGNAAFSRIVVYNDSIWEFESMNGEIKVFRYDMDGLEDCPEIQEFL